VGLNQKCICILLDLRLRGDGGKCIVNLRSVNNWLQCACQINGVAMEYIEAIKLKSRKNFWVLNYKGNMYDP
jgi:hypothetical protein